MLCEARTTRELNSKERPMALVGEYLGYWFRHDNRTSAGTASEVRGTVFWTVNPASVGTAETLTSFRERWEKDGYKIGLLILAGQEIQELIYGGVALGSVEPQQLDATYGTPQGFKWVAWGGSGPRPEGGFIKPNIFTFPVKMTITPLGDGPQMIPVASRHLQGPFSQSLASVWALGGRKASR